MKDNVNKITVCDGVIYFAGMKGSVIIPSKRDEDAGYDVYANFEDDYMVIQPQETVKIPTGLKSAFSPKWRVQLKERGSTGTKGIAQRCGVIDSGYRGEWLVPITNTTDRPMVIIKKTSLENGYVPACISEAIVYPYEKAICQAVLVEVPKVKVKTITEKELMSIASERGEGKIGSSGK